MSVVSEYETVPVAVDDPDEYLAQLERDKGNPTLEITVEQK